MKQFMRLFAGLLLLTTVSRCAPCPRFTIQHCEGGVCYCQSVLETAH